MRTRLLRRRGAQVRGPMCGRATAEGGRDARVSFRTVRPADYLTPYETLLKNQVAFAAVDKGQNRLLNTMARPARDRARLILRARAPTPRIYSAHTRACA
jgi:hypothetical protein